MITSPARGADRAVGAYGPPPRALSASTALVVLLLGALALRLTIAYILFPASGFGSDVGTYVSWALTMATHGPAGFYANAGFIDYPPGYLYVLWPIGLLAQAIGGSDPASAATALIKVPAMLVDIGVGWLLYRLVLGWAWPSRRAEGLALVKPQFGVVLIPLVAVLLLRRHLLRPGSGPRHAPWGPAWLRGWLSRVQGWPRLVTSAVVALVTFHVLALPFGMGIPDYLDLMARTAGGYEYLTVNAYDPWALIGLDGNTALAWAMPYWQSDLVPMLGSVTAFQVGALLLVAGFLYGLVNLLLRDERRTILVTAVFLSIAFFVLPTRVHERYLVPVFALLPLLAVTSRAWLLALVGLAVAALVNLHGVLTNTNPVYGTQGLADLPLGEASRSPGFIVGAVLLVLGGFLFAAWRLWRGAAREPDGFARVAMAVEGTAGPGTVPGTARALAPSPAWGPPGEPGLGAMPAWDTPVRGPSAFAWIVDRVTPRPLRADRSRALAGEGPGRLDRLDLLMVVLVFLSALTLRAYRVAEPYDMYFDEVYHARTAMEFLQDWRYGEKHDIYEWTHPHLAKYAMALGIEIFGDHRVTGTSELGSPVVATAIERRWAPSDDQGARDGDRLYVATGSTLDVYDLGSRVRMAMFASDATALAIDEDAHLLYLAGADGTLSTLDTTSLDSLPRDLAVDAVPDSAAGAGPQPLATGLPLDPAHIAVGDQAIVVLGAGGALASFDPDTGDPLGTATVRDAADIEGVPGTTLVLAKPSEVRDPAAVARVLADALGEASGRIESELRRDAPEVAIAGWLDQATLTAIRDAIDQGTLPGVSLSEGDVPVVAVSTSTGVTFVASTTLDEVHRIDLQNGAAGMVWVPDGPGKPTLYVASGSTLQGIEVTDQGPTATGDLQLPGPVSDVLWNDTQDLVHVVGQLHGSPTIFVVEVVDPHNAGVFMDVPLPFTPVSAVMDTQPDRPTVDRTQIVAFANDGSTASVDVGGNAFGYRMPGVLMGALTALGIYLLARLLFRRRSVALFAAALTVAEGMLFVNSRIAMNDVYVAGFLMLAAALFVPVWLGSWRRWWQVALVIPIVGILLGLALASKWVAAYAMGGFVLLVLLRSTVGRVLALVGMLGLTAVLGAIAIHPSQGDDPHHNWPFLVIMVLLTLALAAAMVRRPLRLVRGEVIAACLWLVIGGGVLVAGALALGGSASGAPLSSSRLLVAGGVAMLAAAIIGIGALVAGRMGRGPWAARDPDPAEVPASPEGAALPGWLTPARLLGVPWLLALACLVVLPLVVYVISYIPWVELGNRFWAGFPAGNTGQDLWGLTLQMYDYHNDLRVPHAASSPWWAWPLNLKPVWFYQASFAGNTTGEIYDSGNLVVFWMSLPAMLFAAIAAWRRRSLALTVIVVMFLAMWLPWARIDRATFQYHYYTSVPFLVLALGYLLAELWHGPATVAWLIARVGAALAILGVPLMWLLRPVLCGIANTAATDAGGQVCGASLRDVDLSERSVAILVVLLVAGIAVVWALWHSTREPSDEHGSPAGRLQRPGTSVPIIVGIAALALVGVGVVLDDARRFTFQLSADELGAVSLVVLLVPAWLVLRARDARRFALGVVAAAYLFLIVWYPNLSGLPVPNGLASAFQGLLPTWTYDFQFAVNRELPQPGGLIDLSTYVIAFGTLLGILAVMLVARAWRSRPEPMLLLDDLA